MGEASLRRQRCWVAGKGTEATRVGEHEEAAPELWGEFRLCRQLEAPRALAVGAQGREDAGRWAEGPLWSHRTRCSLTTL